MAAKKTTKKSTSTVTLSPPCRDRIKDYNGNLTLCTPEMAKALCDAKRSGMPDVVVCNSVGIAPDTLRAWLDKADLGKPYDKFTESWLKARADCYAFHYANAIERDPSFSKWYLSKMYEGFEDKAAQTNVQVVDNRIVAHVDMFPTEDVRKEVARRLAASNEDSDE